MLEICNLTKARLDKALLKKTEKTVLRSLSSVDTVVSLVVVGNKRMKMLNKKYRNKNRVTDVLSFGDPAGRDKQKGFIDPPTAPQHLGEIVICYPYAKKQARRLGYPLKVEMTILLIHGILHLLGHHHESHHYLCLKNQLLPDWILELVPSGR